MISPDSYHPPAAPLARPGPRPSWADANDLRWVPMVGCGLLLAFEMLFHVMWAASMFPRLTRGRTLALALEGTSFLISIMLLIVVGWIAIASWATGRWRRAVVATCLQIGIPVGGLLIGTIINIIYDAH